MLHFLAQLAIENQALYTYGPLGIFCVYFMWRDGKKDQAHDAERNPSFVERASGQHLHDSHARPDQREQAGRWRDPRGNTAN